MPHANIDDLRRAAMRRTPRMFFDYVDGGSYSEATMRANITDFDRWGFAPRYLVDVTGRSLETTILGRQHRLPITLAPTGLAGMLAPQGEVLAARAAAAAGIPLALSTFSICSVETVGAATSGGLHFQLYLARDEGFNLALLERARSAGAEALHFTVDANLPAVREKNMRNNFGAQARPSLRTMLDIMSHPVWAARVLRGGRLPAFGNFPASLGKNLLAQMTRMPSVLEPAPSWKHLEWLRRVWPGKLVFKGAMCVADAERAIDCGADAIVVTNHGGRQLDGGLSSIAVLPRIAAAVGARTEILFDSGIRRGTQIAKALALGAHSVLIGRAYLYGLAAGGQAGVSQAISLLAGELSIAMGSLGLNSIAELRHEGARMIERTGG